MKKSSSQSFGYLFFIIFLSFVLWFYFNNKELNLWFLSLSFIFLVLTLTKSKILDPLNDYWIKLGELLGKVIAPFIMFLIFFLIVTPIAILLKIFKKDLLKLKYNNLPTYWEKKSKTMESMNKQF